MICIRIKRALACGALGLAALFAAVPANAQGKGNDKGRGQNASSPERGVTGDPETASPATPQSRAAYLGSWLDDATVVGAGGLWGAVSFVAAEGGQRFFPVIDMAMGTSAATQAGISVPVSQTDDTGALVTQAFFYAKWRLRDAEHTRNHVGVALTPIVEMSRSSVDASQDVSFGLPVNLEVRRGSTRAYGSVGFFTRGALFQSVAVEFTASPAVTVTASAGHTYSTSTDALVDPNSRHRVDVGLGTSVTIRHSLAIFAAVGRSTTSAAGATWAAAGLSVFTTSR
jgi:hypothetical protein